ncbi:tellurite resistance TerB family protein [Kiloniella laminariae]|uniref:tellurite resistance TerB family protein n=1 Tax=Kiloniella laminariae TaxID=454162 RepID=UPI00036691E7|nr:TerB family tellurite resistance protein [Kiloniella laminariae]
MTSLLLEKLVTEVQRYQNRGFLHASMAVCALVACADGEVSIEERYSIDYAIGHVDALQSFETEEAIELLDDYIYQLRQGTPEARDTLYEKVRAFEGTYKRSRTLMRVAYLIINADRTVTPAEQQEFARLCALLGLEADKLWQQIARQQGSRKS